MFKRLLVPIILISIALCVGLFVLLANTGVFSADSSVTLKLIMIIALFGILPAAIIIACSLSLMRMLTAKYAVSAGQKRYLTFGLILSVQNREPFQIFKLIMATKGQARKTLREFWGIRNREGVLETAHYLSIAGGHTAFADDVFNKLIKTGKLEPLTEDNLHNPAGLENAYQAAVEREFGKGPAGEALTPEQRAAVTKAFLSRVNDGLECYTITLKHLLNAGYTENELLSIPTTAAWDFGRVCFIVKFGAAARYIDEADAWPYLKAAADNASKTYNSWREYFAAYALGRAIAYGYEGLFSEPSDIIKGLINKPKGKLDLSNISFK